MFCASAHSTQTFIIAHQIRLNFLVSTLSNVKFQFNVKNLKSTTSRFTPICLKIYTKFDIFCEKFFLFYSFVLIKMFGMLLVESASNCPVWLPFK
uniref:Uncharacterized protein n=1 Tax=Oryzias melastigma TaxID=30732 RepID=A0A3B3BJ33_ORYME